MGFTFVFVLATVSDASFPQWKSTRYTLAGGAAVGDWSAADKPLSSPILQAELGEATATATATGGEGEGGAGSARTAWLLTQGSLVCCANASDLSIGCHDVGAASLPANLTTARLVLLGASARNVF